MSAKPIPVTIIYGYIVIYNVSRYDEWNRTHTRKPYCLNNLSQRQSVYHTDNIIVESTIPIMLYCYYGYYKWFYHTDNIIVETTVSFSNCFN